MHASQPAGTSDLDAAAARLLRRHIIRVRQSGCPLHLVLRRDSSGEYLPEPLGREVELLGYKAGPEVDAIAVIATGSVKLVDASVELTAGIAALTRRQIDFACVVSRSGTVAWKACADAKPLQMPTPSSGQMLDCMSRAVDVPTPPPSCSPAILEGPLWAARLASAARTSQARLPWSYVEECRPCAPPGTPGWSPPADQEALVAEWERLRMAAAGGAESVWFPRHELCEWMDAGMFSRSVVASIPTPAELSAALRQHLEPQAARRFHHELTRIARR